MRADIELDKSPDFINVLIRINIFEAASLLAVSPSGDHHTAGLLAAFLLSALKQTLIHVTPPVASALKMSIKELRRLYFIYLVIKVSWAFAIKTLRAKVLCYLHLR